MSVGEQHGCLDAVARAQLNCALFRQLEAGVLKSALAQRHFCSLSGQVRPYLSRTFGLCP